MASAKVDMVESRKMLREMGFGDLLIGTLISLAVWGATIFLLRRSFVVPVFVEWILLSLGVTAGFTFLVYKGRLRLSSGLLLAAVYVPVIGIVLLWLTPLFTGVSF